MLLCLVQKQQNLCGYENKVYYMCRKERDATIFSRIKTWEQEQVFTKMSPPEAADYVQGLEAQRRELTRTFEKTPASLGNKHKRWRMAADIEQLKWRTDYLKI